MTRFVDPVKKNREAAPSVRNKGRNIRVCDERDTAAFYLEWTEDAVDDIDVFHTLGAAKRNVIGRCIPERDMWNRAIILARDWVIADVER